MIKRNKNRWNDFIIGQFHGNARPPRTFHAIVNGIWSPKLKNITISKLSAKAYLIKIPCPHTRSRILSQGVWHIERQTMFVAKWQPGLLPETPELKSVPVWLDFHNVPLQFYSEEGLEHIAGTLGEPLLLHPRTKNLVNLEVARVLTVIDPTKPLPEAVNVRFESGHTQRIEVSCQWLPPTCTHCNEVGHSIKRCPRAPVTCHSCKSTAHLQDNCPRSKAGNKINDDSERRASVTLTKKQSKKQAQAPVQEPIVLPSSVDGKLILDIGLDRLQSRISIGSESPKDLDIDGQRRTDIDSSSKLLRNGKNPIQASFSSEHEDSSSEHEPYSPGSDTSFNYSDEDDFPPLSARNKKVESIRVKNPPRRFK